MKKYNNAPAKELTRQEAFVRAHKHYHNKISLCRTLIFILFLALWETAADLGWIDTFFLQPFQSAPLLL